MSFGSGGFGGFGSNNNNNNQTTSTFGGFGSANNNSNNANQSSSGFGFGNSTNTNTAGGGLFGSTTNNNNNTSGGFGASTGGGFGANNNSNNSFGSKPAFGSSTTTTGGGMFGGTGNTTSGGTGFGGFGNNNANTSTSSPFGGGNASGGGLFGNNANKTAGFGASNTGSSLFGGNNANANTTSTGFGSTGFGASNNTALGAAGDPPGTAIAPFSAYSEKEPSSSTSNSFQTILFQDAYKKWSADELRLVDYAQGRRHGNGSGAGAFGVSSGFGGGFGSNTNNTSTGFGSTTNNAAGGGLFGNNSATNNTSTGFGSGGGFGQNNQQQQSGGLFGQNKPATGGLFGSSTTNNSPSGGLFGSSNSGGFGSNNNNNNQTTTGGFGATNTNNSGGLFGNNQQNKPAGTGFSFGSTNNTSAGFGNTNTNTGGGGLFGNNNNTQQQSTGGGLFGNNNQQQQQQQQSTGTGFGGFGQQNQNQSTGGGLFGNTQNKPAGGLFGSSTSNTSTGGGLFGNNNNQNQQQQNSNPFGQNNQSTGGGLFGNKPAGGGLFGSSNTTQNNNSSGGLFGGIGQNNQQQQNTGGGLFGNTANNNNNQQQQKPGGLFGTSTASTGGSLFGNSNNQTQGTGLFGNSINNQQQQQQNTGLGNSILGNSQQQNNAPQSLTASLNDVSAYGAPSLFAGVGGNEVPNPGPLATPLGGNQKPRRSAVLPMYKLAPANGSRYSTPQKRGYGFSYSTYGTPGVSPASSIASTPGSNSLLGRSLLGSSSTGSLGKSVSVNNLRRTYGAEDSILAPGAFSASSSARWYGSTGSKKLVINRDIRSDLFNTPQKDKTDDASGSTRKLSKRVSFDTGNAGGDEETPVRGALPGPEDVQNSEMEETPRQNRSSQGSTASRSPEIVASNGTEAAVPDSDIVAAPEGSRVAQTFDNVSGQYWTQPSKEELQNLNRVQRQKVQLTVGRENVGSIEFLVPVDISNIDIEDITGSLITLEPRSATVYPETSRKPPVGKGLNVPARIALEQSWPRSGRDRRITTDSRRLAKHVDRLKGIPDTTFIEYEQDTGVWTFRVEHFTTYGLDDDTDEDDTEQSAHLGNGENDAQMEDVTFNARKQRGGLPGAFELMHESYAESNSVHDESFLGDSSADSAPNNVQLLLEDDEGDMGEEYELSDDDLTRSLIRQHLAAEPDNASSEGGQDVTKPSTPGGILRARMRAVKDSAGPMQLEVADGDDWLEMLRKSVSPLKRDRQLLRDLNESPLGSHDKLIDFNKEPDVQRASTWRNSTARQDASGTTQAPGQKNQGFATSIDLMNSLFEKPKPANQNLARPVPDKGFPKFPFQRQDKTMTIDENEQAFHTVARLGWGPDETLLLTRPIKSNLSRRTLRGETDMMSFQRALLQTEDQEIRTARFSTLSANKFLSIQDKLTEVRIVDGVPKATLRTQKLKDLFHHENMTDPASIYENRVWDLASILFDDMFSQSRVDEDQARKDSLSHFWHDLVEQVSNTTIGLAASTEEKAVACLAGHRIIDACKYLVDGKNYYLGTLVPMIGTSEVVQKDMREQLRAWHDSQTLSEFSEPIRTIYELLSGNVCVCEGYKGPDVENRMESFVISKKFGFDWKQSFGLRLWYGILQNDDLTEAVRKFEGDIAQDREDLPIPWFVEQGLAPLWRDTKKTTRQDLLWGLLQLYTYSDADLEAILRPENAQLTPLDMRLSWQLGLALSSTGKVSYGPNASERSDSCTVSFAAQLSSAGEWLEAVFVLLHLSDAAARKRAIQETLCRHAGLIDDSSASTLNEKFQIPEPWIWEARALYMRSVKKDSRYEVLCLLRANAHAEAHRVLVHTVAPNAIVERDYAGLSSLIAQFEGHQGSITQWALGGEIYSQFLLVIQAKSKGENAAANVLERLLGGLCAMSEQIMEQDVVRFAAVSDMADETAREILNLARRKKDTDMRAKILNLPLTQDRLLAYSVDLSMDRYREVISH